MQTRLAQHQQSSRNGSKLPVHCAWRAHGEPKVTILAEFCSPEELNTAEIATINALNTLCPNGYNLGHGGETAPSKNPHVAKKISVAASGRKYADTTPWVNATTEKWKDEDYRKKVSDGLKAGWTEERRQAIRERSIAMWAERKASGWEMSEEHREKLRQKVVTKESRIKMSASAKARVRVSRGEDTRKKLSDSTKAFWANEENKAARSQEIKNAWDDEARAKMGNKARESWKDPEIRSKRLAAIKAAKNASKEEK